MKPEPLPARPEDARENLQRLADAQGETLAGLSRFIGRRETFLQAFVREGVPAQLARADRERLAKYLSVPPRALGED